MERSPTTFLRIGAWCVDAKSGQISREGETVRVELRTMRLLLCLAEHQGEVVSIEELLDQAWSGVTVSPDSVYQAVASLRRLLGDDPKQPTYIATVPRLGYRMVAAVSPWVNEAAAPEVTPPDPAPEGRTATGNAHTAGPRPRTGLFLGVGTALALGVVAFVVAFHGNLPTINDRARAAFSRPEKSIAVLPFLDLTDEMNEEPFADGMTEELIDRLAKIPGLRVPAPTSSFYFKGKHIPIADIAGTLGVVYVLDGSVRKSGVRLRVAVRLVRADNGYVVWSETYDRPLDDILMVQDDIAGEVAKALEASIEDRPGHPGTR